MFKTLITAAVIFVLGVPAFAQDQAAVSKDAVQLTESGLVSLDFRDADIQKVLSILAYKSGVNIVAGPEVTGLVTSS